MSTAPLTTCMAFFLELKKMMTLWIDGSSFEQPYFIGHKLKEIDKTLKNIKTPYIIHRTPRNIQNNKPLESIGVSALLWNTLCRRNFTQFLLRTLCLSCRSNISSTSRKDYCERSKPM